MIEKLNFIVILLGISLSVSAQNNDWQKLAKMGRDLYEKGDFESAYQAFTKASELAPSESTLDNYAAQAAYRAGKFKESAEAYQRGANKNADTWNNYNKGNAQFKDQDLSSAIESYKEALRKDPNNQLARHNLTQALKKQENQQNKENQNDQNKDNQDKKDQKNKQDQKKDNNDDKDNQDKNQEKNDKQDDKQNDKQKEQAAMGKEQTDQLLESMMNADKKAQDKLKEKEKGVGSGKREKDW